MKFTPYVYKVHAHRAIDGDTVEAVLDLGFFLTNTIHVRLAGVNTPELKGKQKAAGIVVARFVQDWLNQRKGSLLVHSIKLDKYAGRIVGDFISGTQTLTSNLLGMRYATPVSPEGTVTPFTEEQLEEIAG